MFNGYKKRNSTHLMSIKIDQNNGLYQKRKFHKNLQRKFFV